MVRISSDEVQHAWGRVHDMALSTPITVSSNGEDDTVLLSTKEYRRLKRRDREVLTIADFTAADLKALREVEVPPEAAQFDHEVNG